jgi:DNA-binding phage protein
MVLTRDFRETVQARVRRDPAFRKRLLRDGVESLLAGEVALGKELLRDYINATVGFPKLAAETKLHAKTLHQMFGPKGNPTASHLFGIVAYLQQREGIRLQVRAVRPARAGSPFAKYRGIGTPGVPSGRAGINRWTRAMRDRRSRF